MAGDSARERLIEETRGRVEQIQNFKAESLLGDVPQFTFYEALPTGERIIALYRKIPLEALVELSEKQLQLLSLHADKDLKKLTEISSFNVEQHVSAPTQRRDDLIRELVNQADDSVNKLAIILAFGGLTSVGALSDLRRRVTTEMEAFGDIVATRIGELDKAGDRSTELVDQIEQALEKVRDAAAQVGVTQQARFFRDEADEHKKAAKNWLIATCVGVALLLATGVIFLFWNDIPIQSSNQGGSTTADSSNGVSALGFVRNSIVRLAIFGGEVFLLAFAARNYYSSRHNAVVNKHRENALCTFEVLVKAAAEPDAREAILKHAAECIFAPQPSGFGKAGGNDSPSFSITNFAPARSE